MSTISQPSANFKIKESLNKELESLCCFRCKNYFVRASEKKFPILPLPDHEIDELADNFFCHLHDHDHNQNCEGHENDLTNELNPLRDRSQMRKSVLSSLTLFVLNKNHLDKSLTDSIVHDPKVNEIKCNKCLFEIGYRG